MLRRQARLRREYLYRKAVEERNKVIQEKKNRLKQSFEENTPIHTDLKREALTLQKKLKWDDKGPQRAVEIGTETGGGGVSHEDDEYRWAGVENPKVLVTTSRDPSSRLKVFAKELRLVIPNAQRMNRGNHDVSELLSACRANDVTDLLIIHEHRGVPDGLVVCHLPYGPTAYFNLSGVVMRHDIPEIGTMSEQYPHLIFHNMTSKLATRVTNILKYLFPVPKEDSRRVVTFANHDDTICFRHHMFKRFQGATGRDLELVEIGPRFQLKLYEIKLGTLDHADAADVEWALRPFMNTTYKRRFLSDADGWDADDNEL
ncbi:U3 small nucleolar ribonucleoprotein protein IMP4 [Ischnura elegans]|uniref:U3 small nucleolar ribonucleoprotein protein IMP4 n=1 Tax=Ischnura elegans TaxID=197161 RepID=UPI001ED87288|nr:U3 small nucleolar ribonucleoprotein protein IMP4 [Ischnura elegans]